MYLGFQARKFRENGKENGSYCSKYIGAVLGYSPGIVIMENDMEAAI